MVLVGLSALVCEMRSMLNELGRVSIWRERVEVLSESCVSVRDVCRLSVRFVFLTIIRECTSDKTTTHGGSIREKLVIGALMCRGLGLPVVSCEQDDVCSRRGSLDGDCGGIESVTAMVDVLGRLFKRSDCNILKRQRDSSLQQHTESSPSPLAF